VKTGLSRKNLILTLAVAVLVAVSVLVIVLVSGNGDKEPAPDTAARNPVLDVDLYIARGLVDKLNLKDKAGEPLDPRKAPEMNGRGEPNVPSEEPDYRGVVGYVALQRDWQATWFGTFTQTPWQFAVYQPEGDKWKVVGEIKHKSLVLVADQRISLSQGGKYRGYLQVARMDTGELVWIDVAQFVTVPYWTYPIQEAVKYGYCIAVYRSRSDYEPLDRKGRKGPLPSGRKILLCPSTPPRYFSSDPEHNPMLGIDFKNNTESNSVARLFLFFNPEDLTLVY